ncbi:aminoglycoside 6-adenylyltransferase [Bacillus sp. FJAT-45037]|uniref:aminoglycoside 6-adenylyltransferase n=1 Tax=Bacillus sp. FJAT-45037 TaxID=2011007 RepID=UPI000C24F9DB|nr:aminoglycoside 6-adenylyltransferase [Bacillus sp. FJAT-45037]
MRTEQEMFELILTTAKKDKRIRAVYMNGSRTNPNVSKDIFQDYDIVYVVTETSSFIKDDRWKNKFGDLLMVQEPDKLDKAIGHDINFERSYTYLMLFSDGNRIDLRIQTIQAMLEDYGEDSLTTPLLDKDDILPSIPSPSDINYHVKKPTKGQYDSCTNNFWWCLQNVAKGMWRDELPYAKLMFVNTTRASLDLMINWWIGIKYDFQISTGKMGKYFKQYLPEPYWDLYHETYSDSNYENMWSSIFVSCELFRILSKDVAKHFDFTYPIDDDNNITKFLKHIQKLPSNAKEMHL